MSSLSGRIHRPDGSPVGGAAVRLIDTSGRQAGRASAGPDGSFQISAPSAGPYTLVAMAPGHQPQASAVQLETRPKQHDVTLNGTSQLSGTVRAAGTGEPLARVTLTLAGPGGAMLAAGTTDATGRYLFTDLVAGDYRLWAEGPARDPVEVAVTVSPTGETVQDVHFGGHSQLAGTVRTRDGRPLPDARVTLLDRDGTVATMATTGPDGGYSFGNLPSGEYTLVASGYPAVARPVRIVPGERHIHDPVLGHEQP
jgi:uncharacterized protein YfaS (alpha-2-macroglobulin family)